MNSPHTHSPKEQRLDAVSQGGPVDHGSESLSRFIRWFAVALTGGWIVFIWTYRFLPLQDYPAWIYAGQVLSQLIRHQAAPVYSVSIWPVPNAAFVASIGILDLLFDPETSGKIFLSVCVVLFVLGSYRLVGSMTPRRDSPLFLLPLLYVFHRSVLVGELSFSFGLGVLFFAMAYVFSRSNRLRCTDLWVVAGFALLLFASHAIPYFCWLICLAMLAIFNSSKFRPIKILLGLSPSLLLMALYIVNRGYVPVRGSRWSLMATLRSKLTIVSVFSPLHFFDPFYASDPRPLKMLAIVFNLCTLATVILVVVAWLRRLRSRAEGGIFQSAMGRAVLGIVTTFFAAFLFAPFDAVTGISDFNYRFLVPVLVLILASLASTSRPRLPEQARWVLTLLAAAAATVVLFFQYVYVGSIAHKLRAVYDVISQAQLGPDFRDLVNTDLEYSPGLMPANSSRSRILPVHSTLDYITYYVRTDQRVPSLLFPTSIIRSSLAYPPLLKSDRTLTAKPSAIVIPGRQAANRILAELLHDQYEAAPDTEWVLILRRRMQSAVK